MTYDSIMIHYGELSTKGYNKKQFIKQLLDNVRVALKPFGVESRGDRDHIYVALNGANAETVLARLQEISGIQKMSLITRVDAEISAMQEAALSLMRQEEGATFKVEVRRADKTFPLDSYGVARAIGGYLLTHEIKKTVDVHAPEVTLHVNIREEGCYLSCHEYPGLGGYPLGMNGKVTLLLSGGIDSPVAAYALLRRGIKIECLHFASPPYTQAAVIDKLKDLLIQLNTYQADIRLDVVPFTKLQEAIYKYVPEPYCITIMRRMMMRIAVLVAKKRKALALATGESIGQVASQTLESLDVINEVTNFPILRPLAVEDKLSIIETSKRIGTYDISIRPYEDCCTIFKPKKPKTKPRLDECLEYEASWDYAPMVEECANNLTTYYLSEGKEIFPK